jgi:signal transduction histidine kinase
MIPVEGTNPPKSVFFVPLKVGDEVRGCVTLQNLDRENAFSESDVSLLSTLANSMSVALENARLYNETEQRNAELAVINSVQQGLVAEMDMQGIYDLVGDRIRDLFDSQVTTIVTFNHQNKTENFRYLFEDGKRYTPESRPIDKIREKIINERKTFLWNEDVDRILSEINEQPLIPVPGTRSPKSILVVPMIVGSTVRGYLSLQNVDREHAFTNSDVSLLNTLVNSMSVALENARLFNETTRLLAETEQRATELQTVNNISNALVSQLEFNALIKLIGEQMRITFNADIVYLALYDRNTNIINFPYIYGETAESRVFGNGITEKIILSKEPLLINQDMEKAYDKIEAERKGKSVESYLGVPIVVGKEAIGVISVQSTEEENRFTKYDQRLLTTIAANVGVAMQNAEAYQKLQAALTDLKAAQVQLIQQEKLASLGQLTAGIAHEIKNPLNFVNNFSELNVELIEEIFHELTKLEKNDVIEDIESILEDVKFNLEKIHQHGTRADGIVKSMLLHSRGGSGKMEPVDLNAIIKEYVNLSFHGMRAGKNPINVGINLDLDENLGNVLLISEDFSRVILNLCNNAFDAMSEKILANKKENYTPKISIKTYKKNGNVIIEVEDNGPGIPEEIKNKILQPFFTTKKGTDGTGLGLSITDDIVKAHGGKLLIDTKLGAGTTIKIQLNAHF